TNASGSLDLQGSNFTVIGPMYNLTADSQLGFSGLIDFSMPYNQTSIAELMDGNSTEGSIRLVYYDGSEWHDATIGINEPANKVDGTVQSLGSPILMTA